MEDTKTSELYPTYEDLNKEVTGLKSMNSQLLMQLQQMNMSNLFKRLDYLFKVIESKDAFSKEFYNNCSTEIEEYLTLPEAPNNKE